MGEKNKPAFSIFVEEESKKIRPCDLNQITLNMLAALLISTLQLKYPDARRPKI